jgi:hypothetical protein
MVKLLQLIDPWLYNSYFSNLLMFVSNEPFQTGPYPRELEEHLKGVSPGQAPDLLANIKLGWKG